MQKSAVIEYKHDGYLCEGFAVWDDAGAKRPGILVFPEWGGVGEYTPQARPDAIPPRWLRFRVWNGQSYPNRSGARAVDAWLSGRGGLLGRKCAQRFKEPARLVKVGRAPLGGMRQ